MKKAPVIVVGAGIGGLACALRLASCGIDVVVLERAGHVGGKLRTIEVDGLPLDAGPTVLTMRWVFEELFEAAGTRLSDHLSLVPATILARHAWDDRGSFDLHADIDRTIDAIGAFFGAGDAGRYRAFCERTRSIYRTLEQPFLRASQPNPVSLAKRVGWRGLGDLMRISPFATMWSELSDHFHDARLRQLFGRYATYCGSSPFAAPATLMLIAHVERDGVWMVDGGMSRIARAIADLLVARDARIRCDAEVERVVIEGGRATGVVLAGGERMAASAVVFNGDTNALASGLLGDDATRAANATARAQRSLSAITWHLRARTGDFPLVRHDVFFGGDSRCEFDELFDERRLPSDPTVYVCAQDRDARDESATRTLAGPERLMCLVNAPADADANPPDAEEIERCTARMFHRLAACGLRLDRPTTAPIVTTPRDFARLFPATGGSLYGRATHGWAASFERPSTRSRIPGLHLAGGSVHPGAGLPVAALSGRLAAACVTEDLTARTSRASTSMSRAVATPGGISTR